MSHVTWQEKSGVLIGNLQVVNILDDDIARQVTEELKEGVSEQLLKSGAFTDVSDTHVLLNFGAVRSVSATLLARLNQLIDTWQDLNIGLKLCSVSPNILQGFEAAVSRDAVKIYPNSQDALAAFHGREDEALSAAAIAESVFKGTHVPDHKAIKAKPRKSRKKDSKRVKPQIGITITIVLSCALIVWLAYYLIGQDGKVNPGGTITVNGKPCPAGWLVTYTPNDNGKSPGYGFTDGQGDYEIDRTRTISGILPGSYTVTVRPGRGDKSGFVVPAEYNTKSSQVVEVSSSNRYLRWDLQCERIEPPENSDSD